MKNKGTGMQTSDDVIAIAGFELDLAQSLLRDPAGSEVRLRPQAMAVLQFLARHVGRVVSKDELMQTVWAGTVVTDDSLVQCIKEIRQALRDQDHRIVRTSLRRGYWLVQTNGNGLGIGSESGATGSAMNGQASDVVATDPDVATANGPSRRRLGRGAVAALALGAAGGVAGLSWWLSTGGTARVQPRAEQPSIVVLPIRNISGGERWDRLARGLTEDITTDLARNHWLFIIASSAAFQRAGSGKDARTIAQELGVRFALEGALQPEGDAVRVNARLLEAASGASVWSQRWDKPQGQLFDIQDSIVGAIDSALSSTWSGAIARTDLAQARRRPTSNLTAYELFLIGSELKQHLSAQSLAAARDYLERAVHLDPDFARAWARLSIVHSNRRAFAPDEAARRAELVARHRAASQALRADPEDAETLLQVSWLRAASGEQDGAQHAVRRAVALAPNNADILAVASVGGPGRCDLGSEPLEWARRALRLNPNPPAWYFMGLGISALYANQYAVAVDAFSKAPDTPLRWYNEAVAQALSGNQKGAAHAVERLLRLNPGARALTYLADRGDWGNPKARALFLEGARLAGMPE